MRNASVETQLLKHFHGNHRRTDVNVGFNDLRQFLSVLRLRRECIWSCTTARNGCNRILDDANSGSIQKFLAAVEVELWATLSKDTTLKISF